MAAILPGHSASARNHAAPIQLTLWEGDAGTHAAVAALVSVFNKANPDIHVVTQTVGGTQSYEANVLTKFAIGQKPDLMYYQSGPGEIITLNPANLQDLTNLGIWKKYVAPTLANSGVLNGKHYSMELDYVSFFTSWYNKTVFSTYHLTPPTNFQQLLSVCETLRSKASGVVPIYMGAGDKWPVQILPLNLMDDVVASGLLGKLNTGKAHWTDPTVVRALAALTTLNQHRCFENNLLTGTFVGEQKALVTGATAMVFNGSWMVTGLSATTGKPSSYINQVVGHMPLGYDRPYVGSGTPSSLYLPKTGAPAREAAARTFALFAASAAGYAPYLTATGSLPVFKGFAAPSDVLTPILQAAKDYRSEGVANIQGAVVASMGADLLTWLQQLLVGSLTPSRMAQLIDQAFYHDAAARNISGF